MPFRPFQGVSRAVTSGPDGQGIQKVSKTYPYERTTTRPGGLGPAGQGPMRGPGTKSRGDYSARGVLLPGGDGLLEERAGRVAGIRALPAGRET